MESLGIPNSVFLGFYKISEIRNLVRLFWEWFTPRKIFLNHFLKYVKFPKTDQKSAWKTNKNFLSNFVDLSQYWKFLKILGNPDVISYKKISYKKSVYSISVVFNEFQRFSVSFMEFQSILESFSGFLRVSVHFRVIQWFSKRFSRFQSVSEISESFSRFQSFSESFREF